VLYTLSFVLSTLHLVFENKPEHRLVETGGSNTERSEATEPTEPFDVNPFTYLG
jgi:hypothetical protein